MSKLKITFTFLKNLTKRELNYASVTPTEALLFMTYRCTSRCKMCTIWKRSKGVDAQKELSLEDWKKCVDILDSENIGIIELFGGDSLIRKDVTISLIEYIKKRNENIIVYLPTNCNLLDKETAITLVKAGVDNIYVSLDGLIEIHDKIRGRSGTFTHAQSYPHWMRK